MDTSHTFFPMDLGMQMDNMPNGQQNTQSANQSPQSNTNAYSGNPMLNGGVFMGVSTPPRNAI